MQTSQTKQKNLSTSNAHFSVVSATANSLFGNSNTNNDLTERYAAPKSPAETTPDATESDVMNPADLGADEGAIDISDGSTKAGSQDTPPSKP